MQKNKSWPWTIYFIIYCALALINAKFFFSQETQIFWYYQVLIAMNQWFLIPYCFNAASVILNILAIIPLYGFITNQTYLSCKFWGYFLVIRLAMDFFGKSFESNLLKALFYQDVLTAWLSIALAVILALPSYIALYAYAFPPGRNSLPPKHESKKI